MSTPFKALAALLKARNLKISAAESITGGLFASSLIDISGASAFIECSFVVYSDSAKTKVVGVSGDTIKKHTSISAQAVVELAAGAAHASGSDIGVGITGYADGARGGEVFFGFSLANKKQENCFEKFTGTRNQIRKKAADFAAKKLLELLTYKVGALAGKFLPPQMGHVKLICDAADSCEKLYVVLAEKPDKTAKACEIAGLPLMDSALRLGWLKKHFKNRGNIHFLYMDETGIPDYPDGTREWSEQFKKLIGEKIDAKFFGEEAYFEMNEKYFPESAAVLIKRGEKSPEISASQIRKDPKKYLDFVIPTARGFFEKIIKEGK